MNDLVEALRAQAATIHPTPDLEDVLRRARDRRRRAVAVRAAVVVVVIVALGGGVLAARGGEDDRAPSAARLHSLPGLIIDSAPTRGLNRRDRGAVHGPWTMVLRGTEGSLGIDGAVVTFPVAELASGTSVMVNHGAGRARGRQVVWPVAGGFARVRGDVGRTQLLAIAIQTSIVAGRPTVAQVPGFSVVFRGPYRAPVVHEARYGSTPLGEGASLGNGLTYTGVLRAGGFEDQVFATHGRGGYRVHAHPAVLSSVQGGNATLAWELSPGVIEYVGYSGYSPSNEAADALTRLAGRAQLIDLAAWEATNPQVVEQTNDFA